MTLLLIDTNSTFKIYTHFSLCSIVKEAGGVWQTKDKSWLFALNLTVLERVFDAFQDEIVIPENMSQIIAELEERFKAFYRLKDEAEKNEDIEFSVDGLRLNGINPLFNYQRHGVRYGSHCDGGFLIADEMGLGKSVQGIGISLIKRLTNKNKGCLIICPACVKYNWLAEINKFTKEKAIVIDGTAVERFEKWFSQGYYYKIVNYEILARDLFFDEEKWKRKPEKKPKNKVDTRIPGYQEILNFYFSTIIVDEVHYIKTHGAERSKAVKSIKSDTRIGLTGTPMDGKLEELHSIMEFVQPGLFPTKKRFLERYAILHPIFNSITGYKKVEEVKEKIKPYYIRRLKANVSKDLPDKIYKDVYVELQADALKTYKKIAKRKHELTEEQEAMVAVIRCRQFCDFPEMLDLDFESAKFVALFELLQEVVKENGHKVIIFSQYREVTDRLRDRLKIAFKLRVLDGNVGAKERVDMCKAFNESKTDELIIMTDAGSVGLNLQSATYVIHYDDNYSNAVMKQREDRAHRTGQKNVVTVVRFICKDTVEDRVRLILEQKISVNNNVLDEGVGSGGDEISLGIKLSNQELLSLL